MYTNSRMIRLQDCRNELGRTVLSTKVISVLKNYWIFEDVERSRGIGNGFSMENTKEGTRNYSEYPIGRDGKKAWIRVKARRETMFRREEKPASLFATVLLEDYTF